MCAAIMTLLAQPGHLALDARFLGKPGAERREFLGDSIFPTLGANWSQPSKSVMARLVRRSAIRS